MTISLNIILDKLSFLSVKNHISNKNVAFKRCVPLPRNTEDMCEDYLHVCRLSEALRTAEKTSGMYYICIRDRMIDENETESVMKDMIVVNENMDPEKLLNIVHDIFDSISDWYSQMQGALIHEKPLQYILDISSDVIENTINISDSAFTLLARTASIDTDDEMSLALEEYGYHPENTLKLFRKHRRFEEWEKSTSVVINDSKLLSKYTLVNKIFKFQNTYFTHVVMVCDHHEFTDGLLELFLLLTDILSIYAERNWKDKNALSHNYDQFMTDLLTGDLVSLDDIEERAQYLGIHTKGRFRLVKIAVEKGMEASLGRIGRDLLDYLPTSQVILYQDSVVALIHFFGNEEGPKLTMEQNEKLLSRHQARGGVSNEFKSLEYTALAYEQASIALAYNYRKCECKLHELLTMPELPLLCTFQDRMIYGLLGNNPANKRIWHGSRFYDALRVLYDYDCAHSTNNLELLRIYLSMERKATETGQKLHMHRNNVIYRILRIEELTGLSLDSYDVRQGLELSFLMLELYGIE